MVVLQEVVFDGFNRCAVHKLHAKKLVWDFQITNQDQFEEFIRQIADAWERAEQDKMALSLEVHQIDDL